MASCSNERCTANGGKVSIVSPEESDLTYDGNPKEATLTDGLKTGENPSIP